MPRAAVETGAVDFIMPVAAMPEKIVSVQRNAERIRLPPVEEPLPDAHEDALRELLGLLRARTRHDFFDYKRSTLLRRIERRMQVTETEDPPLSGPGRIKAGCKGSSPPAHQRHQLFRDRKPSPVSKPRGVRACSR